MNAIEELAAEIRRLRKCIAELEAGARSATISSPGGQHSYTNHDLGTLYEREGELLRRWAALSRSGPARRIPIFDGE